MPMTLRERLLTTLRGGQPDRIPWNIYAWLLPNTPEGRMLHQYGLGLMGSARIFRTRPEGITIREDRKQVAGQPQIRVTIETPAGTLTEESVIEPGYGSRWIRKYFITSAEDYPAAEFFFRHSHFEPEFARWRDAERAIGDGGIAIGEIMPVPIAYIMVSWMGAQGLAEGIYDHPDRFDVLMDILGQHYLRQVQIAMQLYQDDFEGRFFWGSTNDLAKINVEGMDWFVWGGRTNGNLCTAQAGLFNRIDRPLNHYGMSLETVSCPLDSGRVDSAPHKLWEWVGNSYLFNAIGYPGAITGLVGLKNVSILEPSRTVTFCDAVLVASNNPTGWHRPEVSGSTLFADGHVEVHTWKSVLKLVW